jgi:hypothetical protein
VDGFRKAVLTLGDEHNTSVNRLLNFVDRLLQRIRVVGNSIRVHRESVTGEIDGVRIVQTNIVIGSSLQRRDNDDCGEDQ